MASRGLFYFVTAVLFLVGILLIAYQKITFDVPFTPNLKKEIWTVEAKVEFEPRWSFTDTIEDICEALENSN